MEVFRVVTLNLMGVGEPLDRRMELVGRGLADLQADVVALQEVCEGDGVQNQAETLARRLGVAFVFARAKGPAGELGEGLALLSRHRIVEHAVFELPSAEGGRIVLAALVDSPAGPLRVLNTHFDFRPEHGVLREQQVVRTEALMRELTGELPSVLLGDLNATPEHDEIRFLRGRHTLAGRRAYLHDAYARHHPQERPSGATWSGRNPLTRRWRWLESDRRIDYVFVSHIGPDERGEVRHCRVVFDQPDDEGQFASDHFGVLADLLL